MDLITILMGFVAFLITIVAYFLQRLVKTLDRIDSNVSTHSTEISNIKQIITVIPEIESSIDKHNTEIQDLKHCYTDIRNLEPDFLDLKNKFTRLETEHELTSKQCRR